MPFLALGSIPYQTLEEFGGGDVREEGSRYLTSSSCSRAAYLATRLDRLPSEVAGVLMEIPRSTRQGASRDERCSSLPAVDTALEGVVRYPSKLVVHWDY